jgi:D-xylose transport system permease protein
LVSKNPESEKGAVGTTEAAPDIPAELDAAAAATASPELMASSMGEYARILFKRIRSGESGALPVIVGLVVIVLIFQIKSSLFLSAGNLVNLMTQAAFIITLGMAEVFVLLLGEIDLAAGFTAACGAVIALYMVAKNYPWWLAPTGHCRASSSPGSGCRPSWSPWPASSACRACCSS